MNWLVELLSTPSMIQAVILISAVAALGTQLGKIKIFNISLGVSFVFFIGIFVGHFKLPMNRDMLYFAQNFGLILFIYSLGLQVGPSFFSSFKKGGLRLNLLSMTIVALGLIFVFIFTNLTHVSLLDMMGVLSGAVTNTPMLGTAQQTYDQIVPGDVKNISDMALACAIAYPGGVVGVIFVIAFLKQFFASKEEITSSKDKKEKRPYIGEFAITNTEISGKTIKDIMAHSPTRFVISRIWKDGKVSIPTSESVLETGDHIMVISAKKDVDVVLHLLGQQENADWNKEDIDWNHIDNSNLVSRQIIVTRSKLNGEKLGSLRLRNTYGINITRVNRAGIELVASRDLSLQLGDKLTVVGEKAAIDNVAKILGNELKRLREPNLISVFVGIALGLLLGSIPIPFPGLSIPIKLGIASGPIIVGILMGAFGPRFHIVTYNTQSANLMLRKLGITLYLACLGLDSGANFFETILKGDGLVWAGIGLCITIIPTLIIGILAIKICKIPYAETSGMLCGSMANPMALTYANSTVEGDEPAVSYATVYPVTMFARIITAQLVLMFLL